MPTSRAWFLTFFSYSERAMVSVLTRSSWEGEGKEKRLLRVACKLRYKDVDQASPVWSSASHTAISRTAAPVSPADIQNLTAGLVVKSI